MCTNCDRLEAELREARRERDEARACETATDETVLSLTEERDRLDADLRAAGERIAELEKGRDGALTTETDDLESN